MGRIARALFGLLVGFSLIVLATCENPLLAIIENKVGLHPNIGVSFKGTAKPSGSNVDVGNVVKDSSKLATFTIVNTGKEPLTLGDPLVDIGGADASSFVLDTPPLKTIEGGANTVFVLEFSPATVALMTATITIKSDDPDMGTYSLTVTGRGVAGPGPDIQVWQGATNIDDVHAFDFGGIHGGATLDVVFTISNVGTPGTSLNLVLPTPITFLGGDSANFQVTVWPPSTTIADGDSTTFTVRFSPAADTVKTYSTTMSIGSNDADEDPYNVALSGSGQEPDITVKQGVTVIADGGAYGTSMGSVSADGPGQLAGSDVSFTIYNTGSWPLTITNVSLAGTNPSDFVLTNSTTSPVAVGGQTSFSVRFDPSYTGSRTATVSIATDVPGSKNPYTFDISGTGTWAPKVYWVARDAYRIKRANLNGTVVEDVLTGLSDPTGLAIDQTNDKMYIGEGGSISTAQLDGSGKSTLIPGLNYPYGIAVDSTYVFWAEFGTGRLGRALLNGTNQAFAGPPGQPYGIAVDPSTNDLYWTLYSTARVYHGTKVPLSIGTQIMTQAGYMGGIAFDETTATVYWANNALNGIFNSVSGQIAAAPQPSSIALDVADNFMFYTDYASNVWRAGLDGSNATVIANSGGSRNYGIALDLVP